MRSEYLTLAQAAAIAGVTDSCLRHAAQAGTLQAEHVHPRLWLTTEAAVRHWMTTRRPGRPRQETPAA